MKILLANVHTPYLYSLAQTGHDFFCVEDLPECVAWTPWGSKNRPRPPNVHSLPFSDIAKSSFDVLLLQIPSQWFERQRFPSLPTIYIEHNASLWPREHYAGGDGVHVVFVSEQGAATWCMTPGVNRRTIVSGIPDDVFPYTGDSPVVLTVVHNFRARSAWTRFSLWQRVTMGFPRKVVGADNEGLGEVAENWDDLRSIYAAARVYFSPGFAFPGFTDIEAAMTGMPIVRIRGMGQLVHARERLKYFLQDKEGAVADGQKWREWALERHGIERFCSEWNDLFNEVLKGEVIK